jgi:hypothetical protein
MLDFNNTQRSDMGSSGPTSNGQAQQASGESMAAEHEAGATIAANIVVNFLNRLRPGGPWQLSAINPNVNNDIEMVTATATDEVRSFINRYNGVHNLYHAPNPVRVNDEKASKTEVGAIEFVLADLDPKEEAAAEDAKVRFVAALKSYEPAPTYVLDSGNGVQL